jgi:hypothetical protein
MSNANTRTQSSLFRAYQINRFCDFGVPRLHLTPLRNGRIEAKYPETGWPASCGE